MEAASTPRRERERSATRTSVVLLRSALAALSPRLSVCSYTRGAEYLLRYVLFSGHRPDDSRISTLEYVFVDVVFDGITSR